MPTTIEDVSPTVAAGLNTVAAQLTQTNGQVAVNAATAFARGFLRQSDASDRISDMAGQMFVEDNRIITGVLTNELVVSVEPVQFAGINAGVRTPTTLDHYSLGGGPAAPGSPGGAGGAPSGGAGSAGGAGQGGAAGKVS